MDYKELFFASVNENEDSNPASEYANGDTLNATFDDLVELMSSVEEDHYGEVADIILRYLESDVFDTSSVQYGDLLELLNGLDPLDYNAVADSLLDHLDELYGVVEGLQLEDEDEDEDDEMSEAGAKRLASFNKSRKKFKKTGAKLKVDRLKNKAKNRVKRIKGRVQRKKTRHVRKKYNAFRSKAIKSGRHVVKTHRGLKK